MFLYSPHQNKKYYEFHRLPWYLKQPQIACVGGWGLGVELTCSCCVVFRWFCAIFRYRCCHIETYHFLSLTLFHLGGIVDMPIAQISWPAGKQITMQQSRHRLHHRKPRNGRKKKHNVEICPGGIGDITGWIGIPSVVIVIMSNSSVVPSPMLESSVVSSTARI